MDIIVLGWFVLGVAGGLMDYTSAGRGDQLRVPYLAFMGILGPIAFLYGLYTMWIMRKHL